jgi:putative ABC transport system permease protein
MVGIVLGVASVVATFGLIDGGRRKGQEFWDKTGGVRKMFIRELDSREMKQNAQEKKSKGLTYDDAVALAGEATLIELVEPTMERQELVKAPGFEKRMEVSGATPNYEPMYDFHPAEGRFPDPGGPGARSKVVAAGSTRREEPSAAATRSASSSASAATAARQADAAQGVLLNSANRNNLEWMNRFVPVPVTSMITRMAGDRENQKVAYINVQARDVKDMEQAQEQVTTILRRAHGGVVDFQVFNRKAFMRQQEQQGRIYDVTFLTCGAISLLVGGIVIMNILLASFNERVREVGHAQGARRHRPQHHGAVPGRERR